MKKLLLVAALALTSGCAQKSGVSVGVLVDAQVDGMIFKSCEIDIQYGKDSSRIEPFSSVVADRCKDLEKLVGKNVRVSYHYENFKFFRTLHRHMFDSVTLVGDEVQVPAK